MRLVCSIKLRRGLEIPSNFRQGLLSLIKESIKKSFEDGELFYETLYSSNKQKPFTFSAFFPLKNVNGKSILAEDSFKFIFSTNSIEFIARVYNGLLHLGNGEFRLYGCPIKLLSCTLLPERKFIDGVVKFKTVSPLLLRDPTDGDFYLYPIEEEGNVNAKKFKYWKGVEMKDFIQILQENLVRIAGEELKLLDFKVQRLIPIVCSSKNSNFIATYPGIKAYLKIQAKGEVLKYIYDIGIGARRSEGFGMLEVVDE